MIHWYFDKYIHDTLLWFRLIWIPVHVDSFSSRYFLTCKKSAWLYFRILNETWQCPPASRTTSLTCDFPKKQILYFFPKKTGQQLESDNAMRSWSAGRVRLLPRPLLRFRCFPRLGSGVRFLLISLLLAFLVWPHPQIWPGIIMNWWVIHYRFIKHIIETYCNNLLR